MGLVGVAVRAGVLGVVERDWMLETGHLREAGGASYAGEKGGDCGQRVSQECAEVLSVWSYLVLRRRRSAQPCRAVMCELCDSCEACEVCWRTYNHAGDWYVCVGGRFGEAS